MRTQEFVLIVICKSLGRCMSHVQHLIAELIDYFPRHSVVPPTIADTYLVRRGTPRLRLYATARVTFVIERW